MADEPRLDGDPSRTYRSNHLGPALGEVAVDVLNARFGRLAAGLDRVAAVGEQDDLLAADDEVAGCGAVLAVPKRKAREVPHVLVADPVIGVDALAVQALAESRQAPRSGDSIGLLPAGAVHGGRRPGEIGRDRQPLSLLHAHVVRLTGGGSLVL